MATSRLALAATQYRGSITAEAVDETAKVMRALTHAQDAFLTPALQRIAAALDGDEPGHSFHGNQWTGGQGGETGSISGLARDFRV